MPESPRWLLATGRVEQATLVITHAAAVNKAVLPVHVNFGEIADQIRQVDSNCFQYNRGEKWIYGVLF